LSTAPSVLTPYLPRIAVSWLAESPDSVTRQVEGTVVFVDVSGFTKLTDRLAARGKAGAEEITDVIGTVFGGLLEIANSYGADLLKWGGDAVLLLFGGPDSAERSTRAAVLMSRSMAKVGRLKTSAGKVSLDVSISAHSDAFDFYLLGDRHKELILTGPSATTVARLEAIAESGEVVASPETASRLDPRVLGVAKGTGVLVSGLPEADTAATTSLSEGGVLDVASLLPAGSMKHLLSVAESGVGDDGEHRQATVAFLEYSGIDALSQVGGPEAVAAALGPIISKVEAVAEENGVSFHETDIGADGGKIVVVGGVPQVRGNDAERVLRAVHEVVADHPPDSPIRLRAGVNAGGVFVFTHDFAVAGRRIFAITGDAMNIAARVMAHADHGHVIATEALLTRTRNPFETEPLPPFKVKGKPEPVVAFRIGDLLSAPREESVDVLPFVGRERELTEIVDRAISAESGSGSMVDIIGPSGIGKTRLISEAIDRSNLATFRVVCHEYESTIAYLPWRRILRRLFHLSDKSKDAAASELRNLVRQCAPDMEELLPLVADVVDVPVPSTRQVEELNPRFRRRRLEQFVVRLLRSYVSDPCAIVIEDAHFIDETSAGLLARISDEAGTLPLLLICSRDGGTSIREPQSSGQSSTGYLSLDLGPLDQRSMIQLARVDGGLIDAGRVLAASTLTSIVERAGGNPLFLRELLRTASGSGGVDALPESIEPLLVAQIDRLPPLDRHALRAASVLGTRFDPELLQDLLGPGTDVSDSVWSRLSGFVHPDSNGPDSTRWSFAHTLMRDAAYEGLPFKRRREMHARAAESIEKRASAPDEAVEVLSLHWLHAENYEQAWRCARIAGDRAQALWANSDAATFYERAFEAGRRLRLPSAEIRSVTEALGDAYEVTANYGSARDAYSKSRRLCESDVDRARVLRKIGVLHERQGRYPSALACYSRGRRMLKGNNRAAATERSELDLASAGIRDRQGRYDECVRFATEAAKQARSADHPSGLAHALYLQHMMSVYLGDPSDQLAHDALAIFEGIGDLVGQGNVLNNLGISAYYRGDWSEALEFYERSADVRLRSGDVVGAATEENNVGEVLSDQGKLDDARSLFESARAEWLAAGYKVGIAFATSNLGRLAARTGNTEVGHRLLEEALAEFKEINSPIFIAETELRLAECGVLQGGFSSAAAASTRLLESTRGRAGFELIEVAAYRLLACSRLLNLDSATVVPTTNCGSAAQDSRQMLDLSIERCAAMGATYDLAVGLATRAALARTTRGGNGPGSVGRSEPADKDASRADEIFSRLGVEQAVITWSNPATGRPLFAIAVPGLDRDRSSPIGEMKTVSETARS
jgi:class 3 adenylate cyclase/tetratricopeptide (TPR) repeat protein